MAHDFEIEPGVTVGQWLHDEIVRTLIIDRESWALDRVGGRWSEGDAYDVEIVDYH